MAQPHWILGLVGVGRSFQRRHHRRPASRRIRPYNLLRREFGSRVDGDDWHVAGCAEPDERTQIEANVELAETLKELAKRRRGQRLPTAVVLPVGYCADEDRWFDCVEWHDIKP